MPKFNANPAALYLTDNGRALCGEHLGASAKYTGRDISGQEILEVTPDVVAENAACNYPPIKCEDCGKKALSVHMPARLVTL